MRAHCVRCKPGVLETFGLRGGIAKLVHENPEACVSLRPGHIEWRFVDGDICFKRRELQHHLIELVRNFHNLMTQHGVNHWVDSGTLLGAVRHEGIIPYDQDTDFGIDEAGYVYLRDHKIDVPAPYVLFVWESAVHDNGGRSEALPVRFVNTATGLYTDAFVFQSAEDSDGRALLGPVQSDCFGSCVHCPINEVGEGLFQIPRDWIFPVNMCPFEDFVVPCPREPVKYLTHMYGDDYLRPD
ncbi:TPA: hypothetical protein N0F65_000406 [Lagenidium giganteum]|uniref:LicD/FKTN/FKRP nucleotidyltransferase domain-containing protein n=1 Tax=Lagenidium giganteum TaxID=4803 RepID=A0AAV2Z3B4_9STRA|nr:TPA: hypothetical protein N0F65_000406 [Lagenidium giganteum]